MVKLWSHLGPLVETDKALAGRLGDRWVVCNALFEIEGKTFNII
jgi:hypothetical protein